MAKHEGPTVIRKYANRRLYNTGTSAYVTLEDLAAMVKAGEAFTVVDARTDADITHQVLTQIIVELESRRPTLLSAAFLRQLIGFYDSSLEPLVPAVLERSITVLARHRQRPGEANRPPATGDGDPAGEERIHRAIAAFERAMGEEAEEPAAGDGAPAQWRAGEFDALRSQVEAMRRRLDQIAADRH